MKIALFTHYFPPEISAPSTRLIEFARSWVAHGHTVRVLTGFPNHPTGIVPAEYRHKWTRRETLTGIDAGIEIFRSRTYVTPNRGTVKRTLGHLSLLASSLLLSAPRLGQIDLVIGSSPTLFSAWAAGLFSVGRRIPFILEVRDLWPAAFVEMGLLKPGLVLRGLEAIEAWLYRRAARIVVVTESFGEIIAARGYDRRKIAFIPNGADTDFFAPGPADPALREQFAPGARFIALYIGAHGISQHLSTLLTAAAALRDRPEIAFVFIGDGAEKEQLIAEATQKHLTNVFFYPAQPHDRMPSLYRMADVCFVPLRAVPLFSSFIPTKLFEIMASGRPLIGSLSGEARAIVEHSGGGLVADPEDDRAIVSAIRQLADQPRLAETLGANGRRYVVEHYCRDLLASRYAILLDEVLQEKSKRRY